MTQHRKIALIAAPLALLALASPAMAGTLVIRDTAALLSHGDIQTLQGKAATLPFDVHLLIEKAGSRAALEDHAHAWVDGPKVVVLGLDPAGHHVVARFGNGTGVKTGDFDTVALAGNTHFRAGEWVQGIETIWTRARASAEAKAAITTQAAPVVVQEGLSTGSWVGIGLLVSLFLGVAVWVWRKRKDDQERFERMAREMEDEAAELRAENIRNMTRPAPPAPRPALSSPTPGPLNLSNNNPDPAYAPRSSYSPPAPAPARYAAPAPAPAPVIINNPTPVVASSNNDLLTGVLIGESLSRPREVHHYHEPAPAPVYTPPPAPRYSPPPAPSSYDSGGSSSSYSGSSSSYGSSSSSYDSGGSSSSYSSSSSSFDSGSSGGGFDSGGGGGDW